MPEEAPDLKTFIRDVPNFPKPGILFKDITPLLGDGPAFRRSVEGLAEEGRLHKATRVAAIESRGFLFGSAVAAVLGLGVVPIRKKGKLPSRTISASYRLEYGVDTLEIHDDALGPRDRVLLIDDVLATGGTAAAVLELVRKAGALPVAAAFLIELSFLKGRDKLGDLPLTALLQYS